VAPCTVLGHQHAGAEGGEPVGQGLGRERHGDETRHRPDPGTAEHGHDRLGYPPHVQRDAVTTADPEPSHGGGERNHFGVQFGIGDGAAFAGLALPVEGRVVAAVREVPVDAVDGGVEFAVHEPAARRAGGLEHAGPAAVPDEAFRRLGPAGYCGIAVVTQQTVVTQRRSLLSSR
jgi:hypothetical protein